MKSNIKSLYGQSKSSKVGDTCTCPSCRTQFKKENYQQVFCKTKPGTQCKDYYWNNVTPEKRNNTTRISPRNAEWMDRRDSYEAHPYSSEALGQWDDIQ